MRHAMSCSVAACALLIGIAATAAQTGGGSSTGSASGSSAGSPSGASSGSGVSAPAARSAPAQSTQPGTIASPPSTSPGIGTTGLHPIQRDPQTATPSPLNDPDRQQLGSGGTSPGGAGTAASEAVKGGKSKPGGSLLTLTDEEKEKVRRVILSYSIAPHPPVNVPLRPGALVPANVELKPLPPEVAHIVPNHERFSYVVVRDQVVIVITGKREIDLLLSG